MTQYPQSESSLLRQQLESLLQEARRNEAKMRRFDQLQRRLIGAGSLLELIRLLLTEYRLAFGVEVVRLALVDPEYEVSRLLDEAADKDPLFADLMLLQSPTLIAPYFEGSERPCLQAFDARQHTALFPSTSWILASVALLPLVRHGALIGCLCIGSVDPERYDAGCGTDFLERLAEIVAISLESAMTQERLKRMGLTDGLTGVQNRRYFEHRLLEEISQSRRHAHDLACMFLDVDKFKHVNDDHGHQLATRYCAVWLTSSRRSCGPAIRSPATAVRSLSCCSRVLPLSTCMKSPNGYAARYPARHSTRLPGGCMSVFR